MPSFLHETLIDMVRDHPQFVPDVLGDLLGMEVPEFHAVRTAPGDLTDVAPTEYRADAVVTLKRADDTVFAVVVEVQLGRDPKKRRSWPVYVTTLHARLGCPTTLLVLCPKPAVARWSAKPIRIGPEFTLRPLVLGPRQTPLIIDAGEATSKPELTLISTIAHMDDDPRPAMLKAAVAAIARIRETDPDRADLYTDLLLNELPDKAAEAFWETFMITAPREYRSESVRRLYNQGIADGEVKGEARGEARGEAKALLMLLDHRGIELPEPLRTRIETCTDPLQLDVWFRRALTAVTVDDVFPDDGHDTDD